MSNFAAQGANYPTQIAKAAGVDRLKSELDEISRRIMELSSSVGATADALYGPRPQGVEVDPVPLSANTVDSRLGDIRRNLSLLESNVARLHQG